MRSFLAAHTAPALRTYAAGAGPGTFFLNIGAAGAAFVVVGLSVRAADVIEFLGAIAQGGLQREDRAVLTFLGRELIQPAIAASMASLVIDRRNTAGCAGSWDIDLSVATCIALADKSVTATMELTEAAGLASAADLLVFEMDGLSTAELDRGIIDCILAAGFARALGIGDSVATEMGFIIVDLIGAAELGAGKHVGRSAAAAEPWDDRIGGVAAADMGAFGVNNVVAADLSGGIVGGRVGPWAAVVGQGAGRREQEGHGKQGLKALSCVRAHRVLPF